MPALLWLRGLARRRSGRLLGTALGVAVTVSFVASLGGFIDSSASVMTQHAIRDVPVDWQILLHSGTSPTVARAALAGTTRYSALAEVGYADTAGFTANTGGTVQTTGPGKALGLPAGYRTQFPAEIRPLLGSPDGVLIAQQTAANLHVRTGDVVTVERIDLPPASFKVDGIVDLPNADSLFQAVGVPSGASPQAPPDNVLLMPSDLWHRTFDPQATVRPDSVQTQMHVRIDHRLPTDPVSAYVYVGQLANHLEARLAGGGVVGDNLEARLAGVREDALYTKVLFLFLGLPGVLLAILLTLAVAASGAGRRQAEQVLLRTRGLSARGLLRFAAGEAALSGVAGVVLGLIPAHGGGLIWTSTAALLGLLVAGAAILVPAWRRTRHETVVASRAVVGRSLPPWWQALYLDAVLLAVAVLVFWQTASTGYSLVLAPEGVAQTSVNYTSFLAPLCLWIGLTLLSMRAWNGGLARGRRTLARILHPLARGLSGIVSAYVGRQRARIIQGIVMLALATSFAVSTAIFNTTYNAQSRVDAQLTNGADVTVTGTSAFPPDAKLQELQSLPGVAGAQAVVHRFAYVGSDLQDIYGIDPRHLAEATTLSNAYFANGDARATLLTLARHVDGVLVSQETANDFQLRPGDLINLRLQDASDHQYHVIPFHFVGIVREFPTAPRDSFLVANADYVARATHNPSRELVLIHALGDPAKLTGRVRAIVGSVPGAKVTDIGTAQAALGSSLTSVDLHGLTRLELAFAAMMVAAATGLIMALGLADRSNTFALLNALGAKGRQLGSFLWGEELLILTSGVLIGTTTGLGVAWMLVKVLTGVFDPPPESLAVPWPYLALLGIIAVFFTAVAVWTGRMMIRKSGVSALRDG